MIQALTFAAYAVTLDGKTVLPHARAAVVAGHVLLPVRALGEALGADVAYDGRAHTITVQRGAHVATIPSRGAVLIAGGRAYAPLRAVAETFGLAVGYEARSRTIALAAYPQRPARVPNDTPSRPVANVTAPAYAQAPIVVTVLPPIGAELHDPYPAISARFAGAAAIDPRSLRVYVDGLDVSAEAAVIGDQVLYTPRRALQPGPHDVTVTARDANGTSLAQHWSFNDTFNFAVAAPRAPNPVSAIWIDRQILPGTNAFDVYVEGVPGITGYVGVDGVGGFFPLQVAGAQSYVAHVVVPYGVYQPYARVAARLTLPDGRTETIVLPERISILTKPLSTGAPYASPAPTVTPRPPPTRRSVEVPTPSPSPVVTASPPRRILATSAPAPTATPSRAPATAAPTPAPTPSPAPARTRRPVIKRTPPPSPEPQ